MSGNTPAEFNTPKSTGKYKIYMWDKFERKWLRYQPQVIFKSAEECEREIKEYSAFPLPINFQIPREHWKIVRVSKVYEVIDC